MKIILSNYSSTPIYEQIKEQIKAAIQTSVVKEGELLPSIRQFAKDLRISVITTTRAYKDLEAEGYVAVVQGKGCYVLPQNTQLQRENALIKAEELFSQGIKSAFLAKVEKAELKELFDILLKEDGYEE